MKGMNYVVVVLLEVVFLLAPGVLPAFLWTSGLRKDKAEYVRVTLHDGSHRHRRSLGMPENLHFRFSASGQAMDLRLKRSDRGSRRDYRSARSAGNGPNRVTKKHTKSDDIVQRKNSQIPLFVIENGTVSRKPLPPHEKMAMYENDTMGQLFVVRRNEGEANFSLEGVFHDVAMNMYHVFPDHHGFHWIRHQDTVKDFRGDYIDNTVAGGRNRGDDSARLQRRHKRHSKLLRLLGMSENFIRKHLHPSSASVNGTGPRRQPTRDPDPDPDRRHVTGREVRRHVVGEEEGRKRHVTGRRTRRHVAPRKVRRVAVSHYEIELFMVADYKDYKEWLRYYNNNITQTAIEMHIYYSFIANWISQRYRSIGNTDPSLRIDIVTTGLLIVKTAADSYWTEQQVDVSIRTGRVYVEASVALDAFRHWVDVRPASLPQSDHWMLFTGHDIYTNRNPHIAGLAKLGGLCTYNSVSIIEQDNTASVGATAAHELGHSLSARHDGEEKGCKDEDNYIMSSKLKNPDAEKLASRPWQFSACSVRAFRYFLSRRKCGVVQERGSNMVMTTELEGGQVFSADHQCQLALGKFSFFGRQLQHVDQYQSMCRQLFCAMPWDRTTFQAIFAMEKTTCGNHKWCVQGKCVADINAPPAFENCPQGDSPQIRCRREYCSYYPAHYKEIFCCQTCSQAPPQSNFIFSPANAPVHRETVTRKVAGLPKFQPPTTTSTTAAPTQSTATSTSTSTSAATTTSTTTTSTLTTPSSVPVSASTLSSVSASTSSSTSSTAKVSPKASASAKTSASTKASASTKVSDSASAKASMSTSTSASASVSTLASEPTSVRPLTTSATASSTDQSTTSSTSRVTTDMTSSSTSARDSNKTLTSSASSSSSSSSSLSAQKRESSVRTSESAPLSTTPIPESQSVSSITSTIMSSETSVLASQRDSTSVSTTREASSPSSIQIEQSASTSKRTLPSSNLTSTSTKNAPSSTSTATSARKPNLTSESTIKPSSSNQTSTSTSTTRSSPATSSAHPTMPLSSTSLPLTARVMTPANRQNTRGTELAQRTRTPSTTTTTITTPTTAMTAKGADRPPASDRDQPTSPVTQTFTTPQKQSPPVSVTGTQGSVTATVSSPKSPPDITSTTTAEDRSAVVTSTTEEPISLVTRVHGTSLVAESQPAQGADRISPPVSDTGQNTMAIMDTDVPQGTNHTTLLLDSQSEQGMDPTLGPSGEPVPNTTVVMGTNVAQGTNHTQQLASQTVPGGASTAMGTGGLLGTNHTSLPAGERNPSAVTPSDMLGHLPASSLSGGDTQTDATTSMEAHVPPVTHQSQVTTVSTSSAPVSQPSDTASSGQGVQRELPPWLFHQNIHPPPERLLSSSLSERGREQQMYRDMLVYMSSVLPPILASNLRGGGPTHSKKMDSLNVSVPAAPASNPATHYLHTPGGAVKVQQEGSVQNQVQVEDLQGTHGSHSPLNSGQVEGAQNTHPVGIGLNSVLNSNPADPIQQLRISTTPSPSNSGWISSNDVSHTFMGVQKEGPSGIVTSSGTTEPSTALPQGRVVTMSASLDPILPPRVGSILDTARPSTSHQRPMKPHSSDARDNSNVPILNSAGHQEGGAYTSAVLMSAHLGAELKTADTQSAMTTDTGGGSGRSSHAGSSNHQQNGKNAVVPPHLGSVSPVGEPGPVYRVPSANSQHSAMPSTSGVTSDNAGPVYLLPSTNTHTGGLSPASVVTSENAGPVYLPPSSHSQPANEPSTPNTVTFHDGEVSSLRNSALTRYTLLPSRGFLDFSDSGSFTTAPTTASPNGGGQESIPSSSTGGIPSYSGIRCLPLCQLFREPALQSGNHNWDGLSRFHHSRMETTLDRLRHSGDRRRPAGNLFRLAPSGDRVTPVARRAYWLPQLLRMQRRIRQRHER